ncbi:2-octaprenyl-6-methoxyphenyl hydroxylase [Halopseudomonas phragmitis]|uniref:2-octaprenyl-6-methoxyphenyl hydroxylase n=3 Tax=Pseudomonadales TaxID=72274 RepID=A0A1V0BA00_9GAMM|nr:2-octaprenyl-6-methoxyphenyl hydroxylase [Halopseudomonas phragmitis]RHW22385.1 2-octaprenyl-6-methoxyphenyl hydroxylase [Pseudomonas jilinensis]
MVGASLALALQECARARGWRLRLIEAQPPRAGGWQPSYDARSTALSQGSRQLFERLGVWARLAERVEPIRQIHVSDRGHPGVARIDAAREGVPALGYVVENAWLGEVLLGALDTEVVEWLAPASATAARAVPGGYQLDLQTADGAQTLETELLVVADGGRSGLLESLGIHRQVSAYGQTAIIANISTSKAHAGVAFERFTDSGPLALLPLSGQRSALVWTQPRDQADEVMGLVDEDFLARLQDAFGFRLGALTRVGERHAYPLSLSEAQEQVRPHLVVLGNAAHSLHPIAGQGFNLSLRDTLALADCLSRETERQPGDLTVLQGYLQRQQLDQRLTVAFSDQLTRLFSNRQPLLTAGRNLGLLGLDILPPAKRLLARQAMGLHG